MSNGNRCLNIRWVKMCFGVNPIQSNWTDSTREIAFFPQHPVFKQGQTNIYEHWVNPSVGRKSTFRTGIPWRTNNTDQQQRFFCIHHFKTTINHT